MTRATPPRANPRRMCSCAMPSKSHFLTPFVSAHAILSRICTFHSHLNFRSFNRYAHTPANLLRFCRYKIGGWGSDLVPQEGNPDSSLSAPPPCSPRLRNLRDKSCPSLTHPHQPVTSHRTAKSFGMTVYVKWGGGVPRRAGQRRQRIPPVSGFGFFLPCVILTGASGESSPTRARPSPRRAHRIRPWTHNNASMN